MEIVPSIEFQKALLDIQMSKGYFAFPTFSIQGQQVDVNTNSASVPIDSAGSRVEYTDLCFVNEGDTPYGKPADTVLGNIAKLKSTNELYLAGFKGTTDNNGMLRAGSKSIRFLPKIQKLSIDVAGQDYPGTSTFDGLGDNTHVGYNLYKFMYPDEKHVPHKDWVHRYNKLRIDYRGQLGLFDKAAQIIDESGVDTNISSMRLKYEMKGDIVLSADSGLKCFVFHYVPSTLLFYPKGQLIKRVY